MKKCNCEIPAELKQKVEDVIKDNHGKMHVGQISDEELSEDVEAVNPDENTLDRG